MPLMFYIKVCVAKFHASFKVLDFSNNDLNKTFFLPDFKSNPAVFILLMSDVEYNTRTKYFVRGFFVAFF